MKKEKQSEQMKDLERTEEYFSWLKDVAKELAPYQMKFIEFHRDFIKTIITLSAWVIAFSVPIFNKSDLIQNRNLFIIALFWFLLTIIFWLYHLFDALLRDRKYLEDTMKLSEQTIRFASFDMSKQIDRAKPEFKETIWIESFWKVMNDINKLTQSLKEEEPYLKIQNWIFKTTFVAFVISLILIISSLFKI